MEKTEARKAYRDALNRLADAAADVERLWYELDEEDGRNVNAFYPEMFNDSMEELVGETINWRDAVAESFDLPVR